MPYTADVVQELVMGASMSRVVKIVYKCMTDAANRGLLTRRIQPIRWERGKGGSIQILAWDLDRHGWRKYCIDNIVCIVVTHEMWKRDIEHQVLDLPIEIAERGNLNVG